MAGVVGFELASGVNDKRPVLGEKSIACEQSGLMCQGLGY
jgi:hypothetical protein